MATAFRVGAFQVEPDLNEVTGHGAASQLEPKAMEVLRRLAEAPGEVIYKERLIQSVWPDTFVTDDVLTSAISKLRHALGDDSKNPTYIQTIARKGYRLIAPVSRVGPGGDSRYQISKQLGHGAMGEVFLARDTLLKRQVALKFVSEDKEADELYRKRLLREARTAASLDHPYICKVYTVGQLEGKDFIAMEYVAGPTLAEKLKSSALSAEEALQITRELAEAVEEAHSQGVIHRDLKPGNIMLPKQGHLKVTDFGLARQIPRDGDKSQDETASSLQKAGLTPGTISYVAPEQLEGKEAAPTADIWAMGVILYELLSGKKPFGGDTIPSKLAAVLRQEPDWNQLPETVSAPIRRLLERCLRKDPRRRIQWAGDIRVAIEDVIAGVETTTAEAMVPQPSRRPGSLRHLLPWVLALPLGFLAGWFVRPTEPLPGVPPVKFEIELPSGTQLTPYFRHGLALSPDSRTLAFVAGVKRPQELSVHSQIYVHRFAQGTARPLEGTEGATNPVFSPDSEWLAFVSEIVDEDVPFLKKVQVSGGAPETVCRCDARWGISWSDNGRLLFAGMRQQRAQISMITRTTILSVPAVGGQPEPLTKLDREAGETSHRLPFALPGGRAILFTVIRGNLSHLPSAEVEVQLLLVDSGDRRTLIEDATDARYSQSGHIVFAREGNLFAVPFDLETLEVTGSEIAVLEDVNHSLYTGHSDREVGAAQFSLSSNGALAYIPGSVSPERRAQVYWVDRQGREELIEAEPRAYNQPRVIDGTRFVIRDSHDKRIWLWDSERQGMEHLPIENADWTVPGPGPNLTYTVSRGTDQSTYQKDFDSRSGGEVKLLDEGSPADWTPDGSTLVYWKDLDIWSFSNGQSKPVVNTKFVEMYPDLSPDGKWLAYTSNESGREEVYVRPFPEPGPVVQISTAGGYGSVWSNDGTEIFYRDNVTGRSFMAVKLRFVEGRLEPGRPVKLFEGDYANAIPIRAWDIGSDGRFLLMKQVAGDQERIIREFFPTRISVIQNWTDTLREKFAGQN